jgi:hypothetical protein
MHTRNKIKPINKKLIIKHTIAAAIAYTVLFDLSSSYTFVEITNEPKRIARNPINKTIII